MVTDMKKIGVLATGPYVIRSGKMSRAVLMRLGDDEYAVCVEEGKRTKPKYNATETEIINCIDNIPDPFTMACRAFADRVMDLAQELDYLDE
jgi:hypothetical protein